MLRRFGPFATAFMALPEMSAYPLGGKPRSLNFNSRATPRRINGWDNKDEGGARGNSEDRLMRDGIHRATPRSSNAWDEKYEGRSRGNSENGVMRDGVRQATPKSNEWYDNDEGRSRSNSENRFSRDGRAERIGFDDRMRPENRQRRHEGRRGGNSWDEESSTRNRKVVPRSDGQNSRSKPYENQNRFSRGQRSSGPFVKDEAPLWQSEERSPPEWRVEASELGAEFVYGVNSVLAALRHGRRKVHKLFIQESMDLSKRKESGAISQIEALAAESEILIERTDKHKLNLMCDNKPHQGLAIMCDPLEFAIIQRFPSPEEASFSTGGQAPLWLALDEVTDPQNLGALLRSAYFLGASGVLVSAKNSAPLSPAVSKASAGAMELMDVHAARNLPKVLEEAQGQGWQVVGAALERSVEPHEVDNALPTILVLGSEGKGLRTNVLRVCDTLVRIPGGLELFTEAETSAQPLVDSLNVSVAGGILLYALLAHRQGPRL